MRILYITNGITGSGGLERVLSVKTSLLAEEHGYEVHILSLNEIDKKPFYAFSPRIIIHSIVVGGNPLQYMKSYSSGIRMVVKAIAPNIISVCDDGLKGFFVPRLLRKKATVIYERHVSKNIAQGSLETPGLKEKIIGLQTLLMDRLSNDFRAFVVLTPGNIKEWPRTRNLKVIANPLSFYPAESSLLENKQVIAVGKQSYQKSYDRLLQVWKHARTNMAGWNLHIYGKKDTMHQLPELAAKLGISKSVFFHDPEKDIEKKYLESSIFVLTSRYEGFGMVIIEAMACGLPVVAFNCPYGPSDIITNGEDGFLVNNGDINAFSAELQVLMKDNEKRQAMGATAKSNVRRYRPEHIINEWKELFNQLV